MPRRCVAVALGVLAVIACEQAPRPRPRPKASLIPPAPQPVLECRFEPLSRPGERAQSGFEMCFSSAEPEASEDSVTVTADATPAPPAADADAGAQPVAACPDGMLLVDGMYCPKVRQRCLRYLDEAGGTFLKKHRCAEYDRTPICASERQHRRFCIDPDEYTAESGALPLAEQSWTSAKEICESSGKRLCFESEWEFACEGEQMLPYPYGFEREPGRCNHDRTDLAQRGKLRDLRVRADERPRCTSPFGVRNMIGNVDEWTQRDGFVRPWRASMRGGWWLAGRNNCRAATTGHDEYYFGAQTGFRCCANAR